MAARTMRGALLTLVVGIIIGVGVTIWLTSQRGGPLELATSPVTVATASPAPDDGSGMAEKIPPAVPAPVTMVPDFATLAERLSPVVVNISTRGGAQRGEGSQPFRGPGGPGQEGPGNPQWPFGEGDPREFMEPFERFFGPGPRSRPQPQPQPQLRQQRSLGSGFILDSEGYILTNNHVVENADEVTVRLDNDKEFQAKVVGKDAKTDIALLRIEGATDLTSASLGDSGGLRVGEWVMAIGNPFGLDHSVTAGIVSAKGRFIGAGNYDDYIQTDAAINPGNSGGPLLNVRGEVVGINSAIFSRTGGNIGIGFAIPINLAKELVPQLKEKGHVTRGWLGVLIQKVTPEIAQSLGVPEAQGALVADVIAGGPAEAAGIKVGDVIVEYDGQPVRESNELPMMVARTPVGKEVKVKVRRDQGEQEIPLTIAELKDDEVQVASGGETDKLGLTVQTLTPEIAQNLGVEEAKGVVVSEVESGSPAEEAGLRRGDVILEINRKPVENAEQFRGALRDREKDKNLLFLVRRGENTIFLAMKPPPG
jgi:serine protease Do